MEGKATLSARAVGDGASSQHIFPLLEEVKSDRRCGSKLQQKGSLLQFLDIHSQI